MTDLNQLAREIHDNAVAHGFWEGERNFGEQIALMHSELSEALEEHRAGKPLEYFEDCKPEGVAVELADCAIRCLDSIAWLGARNPDGLEDRPGPTPHSFPAAVAVIHQTLSDAYSWVGNDLLTYARVFYLTRAVHQCRALAESIGCTDWDGVIARKMAYNATRPYLHGKAY